MMEQECKQCLCGCGNKVTYPMNNYLHGHVLNVVGIKHTGSHGRKREDVSARNRKLNSIKKWRYIDGRGSYHNSKKSKCEKCNSTGRLAVHHKDKNHSNNTVENLETLCYKCHNNHHRDTIYEYRTKLKDNTKI